MENKHEIFQFDGDEIEEIRRKKGICRFLGLNEIK